jgi:hypothetical protein
MCISYQNNLSYVKKHLTWSFIEDSDPCTPMESFILLLAANGLVFVFVFVFVSVLLEGIETNVQLDNVDINFQSNNVVKLYCTSIFLNGLTFPGFTSLLFTYKMLKTFKNVSYNLSDILFSYNPNVKE